jgi:hypothetical protein
VRQHVKPRYSPTGDEKSEKKRRISEKSPEKYPVAAREATSRKATYAYIEEAFGVLAALRLFFIICPRRS